MQKENIIIYFSSDPAIKVKFHGNSGFFPFKLINFLIYCAFIFKILCLKIKNSNGETLKHRKMKHAGCCEY